MKHCGLINTGIVRCNVLEGVPAMYDVSFPTATIGLSHSSSRGGEVGAMSFPHFTTMVLRFYVGVFYVRV